MVRTTFIVLLFATAALAHDARNWTPAKNLADDQVYSDNKTTPCCGCDYVPTLDCFIDGQERPWH